MVIIIFNKYEFNILLQNGELSGTNVQFNPNRYLP